MALASDRAAGLPALSQQPAALASPCWETQGTAKLGLLGPREQGQTKKELALSGGSFFGGRNTPGFCALSF